MIMGEAVYNVLWKKYWNFKERASRSEYWLFILFDAIISCIFFTKIFTYHEDKLLSYIIWSIFFNSILSCVSTAFT